MLFCMRMRVKHPTLDKLASVGVLRVIVEGKEAGVITGHIRVAKGIFYTLTLSLRAEFNTNRENRK